MSSTETSNSMEMDMDGIQGNETIVGALSAEKKIGALGAEKKTAPALKSVKQMQNVTIMSESFLGKMNTALANLRNDIKEDFAQEFNARLTTLEDSMLGLSNTLEEINTKLAEIATATIPSEGGNLEEEKMEEEESNGGQQEEVANRQEGENVRLNNQEAASRREGENVRLANRNRSPTVENSRRNHRGENGNREGGRGGDNQQRGDNDRFRREPERLNMPEHSRGRRSRLLYQLRRLDEEEERFNRGRSNSGYRRNNGEWDRQRAGPSRYTGYGR
jgi:hypothetical protein